MKNIGALLTVILATLSSTTEGAEHLEQREALGEYTGQDSRGNKLRAKVKVSSQSTTRFPKVAVDLGWGSIELGYDAKNRVYRGFISKDCDDPGCLYISLHEIKIHRKTEPSKQIELSFNLDGFDMEEDGDAESVTINGTLTKNQIAQSGY